MRTFFLGAFLFATAAVVACSSDDAGTTAGAAPGTDAGGGNASTPAEWKAGGHGGFVYLRYANEKLSTVALFYAVPTTGAACSRTTSGPCAISDCTLPEGGDAGTISPDMVSDPAGNLTFSGGALPAGYGVIYARNGRYPYDETPVTGAPWTVGDPITLTNTGEWVPRFTTTLPAPTLEVKLTAPVLSETAPLGVDRTQPLAFTWTGATGGKVVIMVQTSGAGRRNVSAKCTFDAAPGEASIPAAVMATMVAGPGSATLYPASDALVTAGDYTIDVSIQTGGASGALAFQ